MVGWHDQLNGHESEQAPGDGDGQGSLVRCNPQGCDKLDRTERLNNKLQSIISEEKDIYNNDSNRNYFIWTHL